jgi:DNA-binding XRE family transcriptional regulator
MRLGLSVRQGKQRYYASTTALIEDGEKGRPFALPCPAWNSSVAIWRLCRAARALLGWRQDELAAASGVPRPTLYAFEAKDTDSAKLMGANNRLVVDAFERAGLGAGVRMRQGKAPQ